MLVNAFISTYTPSDFLKNEQIPQNFEKILGLKQQIF